MGLATLIQVAPLSRELRISPVYPTATAPPKSIETARSVEVVGEVTVVHVLPPFVERTIRPAEPTAIAVLLVSYKYTPYNVDAVELETLLHELPALVERIITPPDPVAMAVELFSDTP